MSKARTPARSASEERHEIKRFVKRKLLDVRIMRNRAIAEGFPGLLSDAKIEAYRSVIEFIDGMAKRDNRKPGGAGRKKQ